MTSPGGFPQLSFLCHREEFQTQCGLSALSCLPQQEMAVVKLGPLKPVLHRVVDFCSPQSVFGGQTRKLTCHLALKFDLSPYLQTVTLRPHTHIHSTRSHVSTHTHSTVAPMNCPVKMLWGEQRGFSGTFCLEPALSLFLSGRITKGQESLWFMR